MIKKIHQLSKTKDLKDFEVESQRKLIELNKDYEDLKFLFLYYIYIFFPVIKFYIS